MQNKIRYLLIVLLLTHWLIMVSIDKFLLFAKSVTIVTWGGRGCN